MEKKIIWCDQYSVGNAEMDAQHSRLFGLCNQLADCIDDDSPESDSHFHEILHELAEYSRTHFVAEEQLLERSGYPALRQHLTRHDTYRSDITEFLFSATMGALDKASVHRFILDWWINHILNTDMQYKAHLLSWKG